MQHTAEIKNSSAELLCVAMDVAKEMLGSSIAKAAKLFHGVREFRVEQHDLFKPVSLSEHTQPFIFIRTERMPEKDEHPAKVFMCDSTSVFVIPRYTMRALAPTLAQDGKEFVITIGELRHLICQRNAKPVVRQTSFGIVALYNFFPKE